ncbi:MAG: hypothetical protein LBK59_07425, partial [Bifidobacteriaceae bacterium]|nr:hypothetical protein [Bifidobacteriaceae bacterium]
LRNATRITRTLMRTSTAIIRPSVIAFIIASSGRLMTGGPLDGRSAAKYSDWHHGLSWLNR